MTLIDLATTIGSVLTKLDTTLQTPGLPDSDWQTLYALRKHLDDQQRDLIGEVIDEGNAQYGNLTTQLNAASIQLASVIGDLAKVGQVISIVSQIASYTDKILSLVGA